MHQQLQIQERIQLKDMKDYPGDVGVSVSDAMRCCPTTFNVCSAASPPSSIAIKCCPWQVAELHVQPVWHLGRVLFLLQVI